MLSSLVDARRGVASQAYHCPYGESVEAALPCLCNAMTPKTAARLPFGGRPTALSMEHGPVANSHVLPQGRRSRDSAVQRPRPRDHDGRRTTARSQGNVARPFRTVQAVHETLDHFHAPHTEAEAHAWRCNSLLRSNESPPRSEPQSRREAWVPHLPPEGLREMGSWARLGALARAPEIRTVAGDTRLSVAGGRYAVEPEVAGATVTVGCGLDDAQLYGEHGDKR